VYVEVWVEPDARLAREGYDLIHEVTLSFPQAALGDEIIVPRLDEGEDTVEVPAGTQPGETVVLRGKGVPHLNGNARGDLIVVVNVQVPKRLSGKAKKLLKELEESLKD
jgi:molecular chaperone DnaJ